MAIHDDKIIKNRIIKCFPYSIMVNDDTYYNNACLWCTEHFGDNRWDTKDDGDYTYYVLNKNAKWDYWGWEFFFKNENDRLLFKLTCC